MCHLPKHSRKRVYDILHCIAHTYIAYKMQVCRTKHRPAVTNALILLVQELHVHAVSSSLTVVYNCFVFIECLFYKYMRGISSLRFENQGQFHWIQNNLKIMNEITSDGWKPTKFFINFTLAKWLSNAWNRAKNYFDWAYLIFCFPFGNFGVAIRR